MIELQNVKKIYSPGNNPVYAVNNVSFHFEKSCFYAITGRSGSGKSTLLHLIGGLEKPSEGRILFQGTDISHFSDREASSYRRNKIGFVFQDFFLENNYSCRENIELAMMGQKLSRRQRIETCDHLLKLVGLSERIMNKPTQLSGGEKQRVAIARSLANAPDIILADEPTGNLDEANGIAVISLLRKIANEGKMVIMVTHNLEDAKAADYHLHMLDGEIALQEAQSDSRLY